MNIRAFILSFLFSCCSVSAFACRAQRPLSEELKAKADSIFIGEAIAYSPRPPPDSKTRSPRPAVIRFKVEKTLLGPSRPEVEVYWSNETFGESRSLEDFKKTYGPKTRVGLVQTKDSSEAKKFSDKPWVLQGSCTPPYMWAEK